jgi:hypothetical protein
MMVSCANPKCRKIFKKSKHTRETKFFCSDECREKGD